MEVEGERKESALRSARDGTGNVDVDEVGGTARYWTRTTLIWRGYATVRMGGATGADRRTVRL